MMSIENNIISGDINAHSTMWYSKTNDHRGKTISELITNSDYLTLNTKTHTRAPFNKEHKNTSPDVTIVPNNLLLHCTWGTKITLSSDHLAIITTIDIKSKFRIKIPENTFTNYNKANWVNFTKEIEDLLIDSEPPDDVHKANTILIPSSRKYV